MWWSASSGSPDRSDATALSQSLLQSYLQRQERKPNIDVKFILSLSKSCRDGVHHGIPPFRHNMKSLTKLYTYWLERMSESPASRIAMVEVRKSLPQAVPSSICTATVSLLFPLEHDGIRVDRGSFKAQTGNLCSTQIPPEK